MSDEHRERPIKVATDDSSHPFLEDVDRKGVPDRRRPAARLRS